jgi:chromosome segregation ATPase
LNLGSPTLRTRLIYLRLLLAGIQLLFSRQSKPLGLIHSEWILARTAPKHDGHYGSGQQHVVTHITSKTIFYTDGRGCNLQYTVLQYTQLRYIEEIHDMARKLVNREDVYSIADALSAEGVTPSSTSIYKRLGHGSLSTITRYLRTWELERATDERLDAATNSVPSSIFSASSRLATKLWQTAREEADNTLSEQRRSLEEREAGWRQEIESAQALADQALEARAKAEEEAFEDRQKLESMQQAFSELMESYDSLAAERVRLRHKTETQGEKLATLERDLAESERLSQERHWQNNQQAKELEALTSRVEQIDRQLRAAQNNLAKVSQHRDDLQQHADDLSQRLGACQDHSNQLEREIKETKLALAESRQAARTAEQTSASNSAALQEAQQSVARLEATLSHRDEALQEARAEKEELISRLRDTEQAASELNGRLLAQQDQVRQLYRELGKCQRQLGLQDGVDGG